MILTPHFSILNSHLGQVMLLAILTIGGTILGATTIAGLLMLYQLRQTNDLANSAKAIFAADAGVECALFDQFKPALPACPQSFNLPVSGASVNVTCFDDTVNPVVNHPCSNASSTAAISKGVAGTAARAAQRAFYISFPGATSTFP